MSDTEKQYYHHAPYGFPPHHPGWHPGPPPGSGVYGYYGYPPNAYTAPPPWAAQQTTVPPSPERQAMEGLVNNLAEQSGMGLFKNLLGAGDSDFWKGALVGATAVVLLSNESLRGSVMESFSKAFEFMGGGQPEAAESESASEEEGSE